MSFYSEVRRVTVASNMVDTLDGKKAEDREAENAAINLAGDIEFGTKRNVSAAFLFDNRG